MNAKKIFIFFFCLAAASAHAEDSKSTAPQGDWIADTKTGCKVWNPAPAQDESIKWSGNCKDGKADGKGSLEWYKNSELQTTITGTMKDGQCAQDCSVKTKDGDSYVGEMKDNLPHGKGVLIRADGKYEGEFKDGERSGRGKRTWCSHASKTSALMLQSNKDAVNSLSPVNAPTP